MSVSRWHMNRIGLVDFWCYENEVFEFEKGHMLLRGSNGSGKSVTMQSFIPLLLDGNKSSERLDPFGTRSRKMETYLIDENSDRKERIGYLYLEFKREDSEIYKTIGMGLHARKGKPLNSWYFVIEDNRRVQIDFSLIENHLSLSEKQLKNILGDQVISSQKEYMKRVNDALFGFENLEDYADAITLLLQLRSPKLSNSLSPQKINEILEKSLQPLSDEDLRPMSEAIVNMDNLQDQLESLKQSLDAAKKLEEAYQNYNKAYFLEKWTKYDKEHRQYKNLCQEEVRKNKERSEFLLNIEETNKKLRQNCLEYEVKKNELSSLKNNDIESWTESLEKLNKEIKEFQIDLDKKTKAFEQKEDSYQNVRKRIDNYQQVIDEKENLCQKLLREMNDLNEGLSLTEHTALQHCFDNHMHNYQFSYTRETLQKMMKQVNDGLELWQEYHNQSKRIEFYEDEESKNQEQLHNLQTKITQAEHTYQQTVEEYLEYYHRYNENNQVLKLSTQEMEDLRLSLFDYELTRDYLSIQKIVENAYKKLFNTKTQEKTIISSKINEYEEKLYQLNDEKEYWESLKDVEPEKSQENILNRQYLDEHHIPYVPFFQLLDFNDTIHIEEKQRIEELLKRLQLLDALVIPIDYQEDVLKLPSGGQDFYLWTRKNIDDLNTFYISQMKNQKDLFDIFEAFDIQVYHHLVIDEKYFQSGIIEGSLSLNQEALYIGYESRLKLKQEKIAYFSEQISIFEKQKNEYLEKEKLISRQIEYLEKEFDDFLDERELKEVLNEVDILKKDYLSLEDKIEKLHQMIIQEQKQLKNIYNQLQVISSNLLLPNQYEAFQSYKNDLQEYQNYFENFKDNFVVLLQQQDLKNLEEEKEQQLIEDIDELKYEKEQLKYKRDVAKEKIDTIQHKLDEIGFTDIIQQIEKLQSYLHELENDKIVLEKEITRFETEIEHVDQTLQDLISQKTIQHQRVEIYKDIFEQEKNYHFVYQDNSKQDLQKILSSLAYELGNKKTLSDYQIQLQRVYFEQNMYLSQFNIVQENVSLCHEVDDIPSRMVLKATDQGKKVPFLELIRILMRNIEMQVMLIVDEDRHIFEEILVNTIGKKIRERIQLSRRWVEKIQNYMNDMNTSSGLQLSLKWRSRKAIDDKQLDTAQLVELLEKDYHVLKDIDRKKISNHFRSKIASARKLSQDENTTASFHQLMKEVMDYRKWFDFTLYAKKPNENRKELTSHVFYAYSGGEKALSMYVPLFSAVAAKFESARNDAPLLIALDEAFAGVDENNIDNMFDLITKFGFDYIMNSQVLWGDYPSCSSLAIYELFRPQNAPFVTVIAYIWNGHQKKMRYQ